MVANRPSTELTGGGVTVRLASEAKEPFLAFIGFEIIAEALFTNNTTKMPQFLGI